jgi:hypothetical protein
MAVESMSLLHALARPGSAPVGVDDPTQDLSALAAANDDPTEDLPAGDGPPRPAGVPAGNVVADRFAPGVTLGGRYVLEAVIGTGGFCHVLRALDRRREASGERPCHVAIKALKPAHRASAVAIERLRREFHELRRLQHPGVVQVLDLASEGGEPFTVMELLEGRSLAACLGQAGGRLPRAQAEGVLRSCAAALDWVHREGCVHGDVKPGNLFVTPDGRARLLDFGGSPRASGQDGDAGPEGSLFATPAYASPDVLAGRPPQAADDLYSFACVTFELLTGVHPFGRVDALRARDRGMQPAGAAALGPQAAAELARGLAFARGDRPASAEAWLAQVLRALQAGPAPVARSAAGRLRALAWISLAASLAAAAVIWRAPAPVEAKIPVAPTRNAQRVATVPARPAAADVVATDPVAPVEEATPTRAGTVGPGPGPAPAAPAALPRPVAPRLSFGRDEIVVSRSASAAAVPVRRDGGAGPLRASWRIEPGSARAGLDFGGPLAGTLTLADGQQASTLFIPVLDRGDTTGDVSFAVVVVAGADPAQQQSARVNVVLHRFAAEGPPAAASRGR